MFVYKYLKCSRILNSLQKILNQLKTVYSVLKMTKNNLIICFLLALVLRSYSFEIPKPIVENKIANILLKSSSLIADSPQRSLECFSIYIPKLNELTENYEAEYETCLKRSSEDRDLIDREVERDRKDLEESAVHACAKFSTCSSSDKNAYEFFECFSDAVS